jgi:glyoxylase-like metal-dependent hydrolase (beta-lactamase superfamily II)
MVTSHTLQYVTQSREAAARSSMKSQTLHGGLSVLFGTGGNIGVFAQATSLLLVDAGWSPEQTQIVQALSQVSSLPPSHLINTHWHFDHTDGNEWVQAKGAIITAHLNTLKRLATTQYNDALGALFPASRASALPTDLFETEKHTRMGDVNLRMRAYPLAHTDGDISVHFEELDILHVGDTWSNGLYPFIDAASGGHIDGMIHATEANLRLASAGTVIIPGHGSVGDREQLQRSLDMLTGVRETVATRKRQGLTLAEVIQSNPAAPYESHFSNSFVPVEVFLGCVYVGV